MYVAIITVHRFYVVVQQYRRYMMSSLPVLKARRRQFLVAIKTKKSLLAPPVSMNPLHIPPSPLMRRALRATDLSAPTQN